MSGRMARDICLVLKLFKTNSTKYSLKSLLKATIGHRNILL